MYTDSTQKAPSESASTKEMGTSPFWVTLPIDIAVSKAPLFIPYLSYDSFTTFLFLLFWGMLFRRLVNFLVLEADCVRGPLPAVIFSA